MYRFILFVFILMPGISYAVDGYKNKAAVDSVSAKGFFKIILSPDILSFAKDDLSDIRIINSKQEEIPYLLVQESAIHYKSYFLELKIDENTPLFTPKTTRIIISNADKKVCSGFLLIIRNADIEPEVTIKGSDDKRNWYFISRGYLEKSVISDNDTSEIRSVQFPKNNYAFFEISVLHKKGEPIQVLHAGYNNSEISRGLYTNLPGPKIIQKDSLKKSYVSIIFKQSYVLNKIVFDIEGPDFYMRSCHIGKYMKERNNVEWFNPWYNLTLSSDQLNSIEFDAHKADTLFLEIENADNLPLKIKGVTAYQLNRYLIAQLDKNELYSIYFNNPERTGPEYDLKYFSKVIPANLPILNVSTIQMIEHSVWNQPQPGFFNKITVWIIIILVISILGIISFKMVREMQEKANHK
jgi:hypothetical protein